MSNCPRCDHSARLLLQAQDYNLTRRNDVFNYYRCTNQKCGVVFLYPVPTNLGDYYPDDYDNYQRPQNVDELAALYSYQEDIKLKHVLRFVKSGKLLEIGSSYGGFAYRAHQAGFDVDAIEMNADACRFMNEVIGINAYQSQDPITAIGNLGQFDVIALWHVIEHLADPWTLLDRLPDHLAPSGIIVIAAPNPASIQFRLFRAYWRPLEAPRHLNLIPAQVIKSHLEKRGMIPRVFDSQDEMAKLEDYTNWHKMFTCGVSNPLLRKVARVVSGLTHILIRPFEEQRFGRSSYTLIFQRPNTS